MNIVTRKKVTEVIRLLQEMESPALPGSVVKARFSDLERATIEEAIGILKGYLRVLIMLQQFRVAFLAFFTHYPELFGEQDERGPFD